VVSCVRVSEVASSTSRPSGASGRSGRSFFFPDVFTSLRLTRDRPWRWHPHRHRIRRVLHDVHAAGILIDIVLVAPYLPTRVSTADTRRQMSSTASTVDTRRQMSSTASTVATGRRMSMSASSVDNGQSYEKRRQEEGRIASESGTFSRKLPALRSNLMYITRKKTAPE